MASEPIRITRGPGGEVEVDGAVDQFAASILARAGFETWPSLRGQWIRLPFDMGEGWENEHASWAAEMLTAARYAVDLSADLRTSPAASALPATRRTKTAMTTQPTPPAAARRQRR
ncbi:hypothetical protein [Streptomyces silvisoli]|uniref:Uncharacterized protein n=1 Tax=Streptomyces silvisoli TaxID=3034235 RepID=A0ABT5ZRG5_9ACTN|nr:hypothetical protein [Streptomyces silvisoli]MDF3292413.1 hypothetical protein [Streptomyces silvisoli]